jgi:hypothetical protein
MKNPFGNQLWYASTIHKQIILTKEGKKTKKIVSYDTINDRIYAYFDKRARTVKYVDDNIWQEIED